MSSEKEMDPARRGLLVATAAAGGVAGLATAGAFVCTFQPSERAKAAGAPVEADVGGMAPGEMRIVEWRGKPVWILKRSPEQLKSLEKTAADVADPESLRPFTMEMPEYCKNATHNRGHAGHEDVLVVVGICPHLGCSPTARFTPGPQPSLPDDWSGGFLCPCHGSTFDMAGRVYKNKPAPSNLDVPRYMYLTDNRIVIGKDEKGEA